MRLFPVFVCCKHAELGYECGEEGCCWHTLGFARRKKRVTAYDRKIVERYAASLRERHGRKV